MKKETGFLLLLLFAVPILAQKVQPQGLSPVDSCQKKINLKTTVIVTSLQTIIESMEQTYITCAANIHYDQCKGERYYIEILSDDVLPHRTYIKIVDGLTGNEILLKQVNPDWSHQVFVSRNDYIQLNFTYPRNASNSGYRIRLTCFPFTECPPNWYHIGRYCFSPPSDSFLGVRSGVAKPHAESGFAAAQEVCKRMRANLLVASPAVLNGTGVRDLQELAKTLRLTDPVWIGLRNHNAGDLETLEWLDGTKMNPTSDSVSCSTDDATSVTACQPAERYAFLRSTPEYYLVLDNPDSPHQFVCYAPLSGTDIYFSALFDTSATVPKLDRKSQECLPLLVFVIFLVVVAIVVLAIFFLWRHINNNKKRSSLGTQDRQYSGGSSAANPIGQMYLYSTLSERRSTYGAINVQITNATASTSSNLV